MRICLAQTRPFKGDIGKNIDTHIALIDAAISREADCIFFPELSLTGYEPKLASKLAMSPGDERLRRFQDISHSGKIIIGVGIPAKSAEGLSFNQESGRSCIRSNTSTARRIATLLPVKGRQFWNQENSG